MEQKLLTTNQLDALREVFNMGAGNATTSLSSMLGKVVRMSVPSVNMKELNSIIEEAGEDEVVGIVVRVLGDIPGNVLIIFDYKAAVEMISSFIGGVEKVSEMGESVMSEVGNILSTSYMSAVSKFTHLVIRPSVPAVACDMFSSILSTTVLESGQYDKYILDIETIFKDEKNQNLGAHFYYVPVPGAIERLLKTIGVK